MQQLLWSCKAGDIEPWFLACLGGTIAAGGAAGLGLPTCGSPMDLGFWSRCSSPQGGFSGVNPRGVVLSGRGKVPACLAGAGVKKLRLLEEEKGNHLLVWPGTGV